MPTAKAWLSQYAVVSTPAAIGPTHQSLVNQPVRLLLMSIIHLRSRILHGRRSPYRGITTDSPWPLGLADEEGALVDSSLIL